VGAAGWTAIANALEGITSLTSLNGCALYPVIRAGGIAELQLEPATELCIAVARYLPRSASTLTKLDLRSNALGPGGGTAVAGVLELLTVLGSLDLRANQVGAAGWTAIANALEGITSLTSLNGCALYPVIRAGGIAELQLEPATELCIAVARYLPRSASTLTKLDLRCPPPSLPARGRRLCLFP